MRVMRTAAGALFILASCALRVAAQSGGITGAVTRADTGAPVDLAAVSAYGALGPASSVTTGSSGSTLGVYTIGGLTPGVYFVGASAGTGSAAGLLTSQLYSGVSCPGLLCSIDTGTPVMVTAGATTSGINIALPPAGSISGRVTAAATGLPVANVSITVTGIGTASAMSSVSGAYIVNGLAGGHYNVSASLAVTPLVYRDTTLPASVTVVGGTTTSGIDFQLRPAGGGSISGKLLRTVQNTGPFERIVAYTPDGTLVRVGRQFKPDPNSLTDSYVIDGLDPGSYLVRYEDPLFYNFRLGVGGQMMDQTYGTDPCVTDDCDLRRGQPVTVGSNQAVTGIDLTVAPGATIWSITDGLEHCQLFDSRGVRVANRLNVAPVPGVGAQTEFVGLPGGNYFLRDLTDSCTDCAATTLAPISLAGVPLQSECGFSGVFRTLSGTIHDSATHSPVAEIVVEIRDVAGQLLTSTASDAVGAYSVRLQPAVYYLRTRNDRGYVDTRFLNVGCGGCEPTLGTPLIIAGSDLTGIDFDLAAGGTVAAAIVDEQGVVLTSHPVSFLDSNGQIVARGTSDALGVARAALPAGSIFARTEPVSGRTMQLYGAGACGSGACMPSTGTAISVSPPTGSSIAIAVPSCTAPEISPRLLASAVMGHAYRQVFSSSHPASGFYVFGGRLPAGLTLDAVSGLLSGTPTEGGTFGLDIATIDAQACARTLHYTLQVAKCTFTISPSSATVTAAGGAIDVAVSDACGVETVTSNAAWAVPDVMSVPASSHVHVTIAPNPNTAARSAQVAIGRRLFSVFESGSQSSPPFGSFDAPSPDGATVAGSIAVSGWALDDVQVTRVSIYREPVAGEAGPLVFIGNAVFVDGARPDVEKAFPTTPFNTRAGWGYLLLTNMLPNQGNGIFRLHAIAVDNEGNQTDLGTKTIVCANKSATFPFGAIDTPGQGEVVSGASYINFGWALTPQPKSIATDGSTIQVVIDGVSIGHPSYNFFRSDVSSLFPGLANSNGPVGFLPLDTTALAEGIHTIAWLVFDNALAASGIGSRYFTVSNSADAQPAGLRAGADLGRAIATAAAVASEPRSFTIGPLSLLTVDLGVPNSAGCAATYAGYLAVDDTLRELPAGATLDARGRLAWQPGPAFHGSYHLTVIRTDCAGEKSSIPLTIAVK
jgi:hypothetical protein